MSHPHPAATFVHTFHAALTCWFAGEGDINAVRAALAETTPADMRLVYPSGRRLTGAEFLAEIEGAFGHSPRFRAWVTDVEVVRATDDFAVIAYQEHQTGARSSASKNSRSVLAVVECAHAHCRWQYIQETGI